MRRIQLLTSLLLLLPLFASASQMSEEKSKCITIENKAQEYRDWSYQLARYMSKYNETSDQARMNISKSALKKISRLTQEFAKLSDVKAPERLIDQSKQFIREVEAGHIPVQSANKVMKSALHNYQDQMNEMLYKAQTNHEACSIANSPVYTNSNSSSSGIN